MRKLLISFITIVLVLTFGIPVLAEGDWQAVSQVIDDGHGRVGITIGTENADPNLLFAISETISSHSITDLEEFAWSEPRLMMSNDRGKSWRQIHWPPKPESTCDFFSYKPYFYKGKLRVDVNEYEVKMKYIPPLVYHNKQLIKVSTYDTANGSSWSIVTEEKKPSYKLYQSQGELIILPEDGLETMLATNVKDYYAVDEQTVLIIRENGVLYRATTGGSKEPVNGVQAACFVDSEPSNPVVKVRSDSDNREPSASGPRSIATVNYHPLAISISKDNGRTWNGVNCEMPAKVFDYNKNVKVFLTNNDLICVTDMLKTALVSNDNGASWKAIELPKLMDRNIGESMQLINDNGTIILFYTTRPDTYRYEYKIEQKTDLKPAG